MNLNLCGFSDQLFPYICPYFGPNKITANRIEQDSLDVEEITFSVKGWVEILNRTEMNAAVILQEISYNQNISQCLDVNKKLIDRDIVHQELEILSTAMYSMITSAFKILKQEVSFEKEVTYIFGKTTIREKCAELQILADQMIYKFVQYSEHKNEELLLLTAKLDVNSPLNHIPKDLINLFATTMFELKLNDAKNDCKAI